MRRMSPGASRHPLPRDVQDLNRRLGRDAMDGAPDVAVEYQVAKDEDARRPEAAHDFDEPGVHERIVRPPSAATTPESA